jgi:hypothetical protein
MRGAPRDAWCVLLVQMSENGAGAEIGLEDHSSKAGGGQET